MDIKTIKDLNTLNQQFYKTVGKEFDRTRQQYWEGWDTLLPYLQSITKNKQQIRALDLACGNSRFGRFMDEYLKDISIEYHGIEREPQLITLSYEALEATSLKVELERLDIVNSLIDSTFSQKLTNTYDIIVIFGLLHHIPSKKLRENLISVISDKLANGGLLIVSSWQFAKLPRFYERFIDPKILSIDSKQLEVNDYILDWQREHTAYRYCHYSDENDLINLAESTKNLKIIKSFYADGKTHTLNCYVIAEKL